MDKYSNLWTRTK